MRYKKNRIVAKQFNVNGQVGKGFFDKIKSGFQDVLDFSNPVKQAKVWQQYLKDLQAWAEDVKKNGKKNPSIILNPPLLKTGFKPLDEKILKELEKKKKELDKYVIDTTIMKPLGLPTTPDTKPSTSSASAISTPSCEDTLKKLEEMKSKYETCDKNLSVAQVLLKQVTEEIGAYENKCPNSDDELIETKDFNGKKYAICKGKKKDTTPRMTFAQMKAMGLAGRRPRVRRMK